MSTAYHGQYFAYELTKKSASNTVGRLSQSLINATVDLNSQQVKETQLCLLFEHRWSVGWGDLRG